MSKILIIGKQGQLGQCFEALLKQQTDFTHIGTDRDELDICDTEALAAFFENHQPKYCINCAAYTAVDRAESDEDTAFEINSRAVFQLGELCKKHECILIHFSTDYVYHNGLDRPLIETDPTKPKSVYGESKREGEKSLDVLDFPCLIFRVSWLYSPYGNNFVKTMLRLTQEKPSLDVVYDQIGCLTYGPDLARDILKIIDHIETSDIDPAAVAGIYNYTQHGICSWYDATVQIQRLTGAGAALHPVTTDAFPRPAPRPNYSVLNTSKLENSFPFIHLRYWIDCLEACIRTLEGH